ncbi:toxin-antitoxin system YwqK family antitoxin [Glaciimonas sp. PCH181]|uniref:toxin-antitoxin system YwqK family antitoxin n=1 Tax=Glaciimonas sp. PCH181 TaxID=2133943 RepID=UPI000D3807D3|nr:hypothetical protein [Glaciimonas sp. PCH181]PUA19509.1 hypothetical protein C7W93_06525 [Glaciimonas sp. PCH181]
MNISTVLRYTLWVGMVGATLVLAGCGKKVLDFRNAEIVNGKIFPTGTNSPFSGRVTNMRTFQLPPLYEGFAPIERTLNTLVKENYYLLGEACDVTIKNGSLQGKGVCRPVKSDQVTSEFSFDNGVLQDRFKLFSSTSGKVIAETNYDKGHLDGKMQLFNPDNGKLIYKNKWKEGKQDGDVTQYTLDGEYPLYEVQFVDGKKNGIEKTYHPTTHKLIQKTTYKDDVKTGTERAWSEDGSVLWADLDWVDGKASGFLKQLDPTGTIRVIDLIWKEGKKTGLQIEGSLTADHTESYYKNGLLDGPQKKYRLNPSTQKVYLYVIDNYKEGKRDGPHQELSSDGTITYEINYKDDVEISSPSLPAPTFNTQPLMDPTNIGNCVESWVAAYRQEAGDEALIRTDQRGEWKEWCTQGKKPK